MSSGKWSGARRPMGMTFFVLLAFAALTFTSFADAQSSASTAKSAIKPALNVHWVQPKIQSLPASLSANGSIAAWAEASVSAEIGGSRLAQVNAQIGDFVKKGQVLARFSTENAGVELELAKAQLAEAEAGATDAVASAERARAIEREGFYSPAQLVQIVSQEKVAIARVRAAKVKLVGAELVLKETDILAPDEGVISAKSALLGAVVPVGTELFRLIRQGRLEWRAELTSTELTRIKLGMSVMLTGQVPGKVRLIAPTVDPVTRTALVFVDIPALQALRAGLRAGSYARGEFALGKVANQLTLPQSALVLRDGFSYVFVRGETQQTTSKVIQVKVQTGARSLIDGVDTIAIAQGLKPDAWVVASGAAFLADGDIVKASQL